MFRVKNILVPCDFSPFSDSAVQRASDLAMTFDARLHLLHVVPPPGVLGPARLESDRVLHAQHQLEQQLEPHVVVKLSVERSVVSGAAHRAICDYAREHDIDLIVMGTHGRTGLAHAALGSVAERVLRGAPSPVLIVRHVSYADLNLATKEGAKILDRRVGSAVSDVCVEANDGDNGSFDFKVGMLRCSASAWNQARPQIDLAVQRAREMASTGGSAISVAAISISAGV